MFDCGSGADTRAHAGSNCAPDAAHAHAHAFTDLEPVQCALAGAHTQPHDQPITGANARASAMRGDGEVLLFSRR